MKIYLLISMFCGLIIPNFSPSDAPSESQSFSNGCYRPISTSGSMSFGSFVYFDIDYTLNNCSEIIYTFDACDIDYYINELDRAIDDLFLSRDEDVVIVEGTIWGCDSSGNREIHLFVTIENFPDNNGGTNIGKIRKKAVSNSSTSGN